MAENCPTMPQVARVSFLPKITLPGFQQGIALGGICVGLRASRASWTCFADLP